MAESESNERSIDRSELLDGDVIHHAVFDARATVRANDDGSVDLEWEDGDLHGKVWRRKSATALNRGVGDTITIVDGSPDAAPISGSSRNGGSRANPTAGPGEWLDRTISCPECNQFAGSGQRDDGTPYAECSRCGWTAGEAYLVEHDHFVPEDADGS